MERWQLVSIVTEAVLQNYMQIYERSEYPEIKKETRNTIRGRSYTEDIPSTFNIKTYSTDLADLKCQIADKDIDLLKYADIVGITTTGASKNLDVLKKLNPPTYIVEEAAEALESHILTALVPSIKHLILIGDHFQLRPLPNEHDLAVNYKLEISLFERLVNNGVPSKCLEVQHRMRPSISYLLVPEFYSNLRNHSSVEKFKNIIGVSSNVFFMQHSHTELEVNKLKSYSNPYEAEFVISFSEYLISQGHKPESITILTTYSGQLDLIKKQMRNKRTLDGILATTVDGYQGEENDIILLSFVRSNPQNTVGFIKTKNRICVALSRARKGLYCFGNFKMFASQSSVWRKLVTKLALMNSFGEQIEVYCCEHPEKRFRIKTPRDLCNYMTKGCKKLCNTVSLCRH